MIKPIAEVEKNLEFRTLSLVASDIKTRKLVSLKKVIVKEPLRTGRILDCVPEKLLLPTEEYAVKAI